MPATAHSRKTPTLDTSPVSSTRAKDAERTDGVAELAVTAALVVGLHDDSLAASEAAVQQDNNLSVLDTAANKTPFPLACLPCRTSCPCVCESRGLQAASPSVCQSVCRHPPSPLSTATSDWKPHRRIVSPRAVRFRLPTPSSTRMVSLAVSNASVLAPICSLFVSLRRQRRRRRRLRRGEKRATDGPTD